MPLALYSISQHNHWLFPLEKLDADGLAGCGSIIYTVKHWLKSSADRLAGCGSIIYTVKHWLKTSADRLAGCGRKVCTANHR